MLLNGLVHDWNISKHIAQLIDLPVFVAGGLNPKNVAAAIATISPAGVDVNSGTKLPNKNAKDKAKVHAFIHAARAQFSREKLVS